MIARKAEMRFFDSWNHSPYIIRLLIGFMNIWMYVCLMP